MSDQIQFDVLIVGGGPAGLACAIQLAQLAQNANRALEIGVIEKGAEIGAHILSGAVIETSAIDRLCPDWQTDPTCPIRLQVKKDQFLYLTKNKAWRWPVPPDMRNPKHYIVSLSEVCRWLAQRAEALGVHILPGYPGARLLYDDHKKVIGVLTQEVGRDKSGHPTPEYQPGIEIHAKHTVLAEGVRGSLTKTAIETYQLQKNCDPHTYALGLKEIWQINPDKHQLGHVIHTVGWPLHNQAYGGSFLYHISDHKLAIGLVVGLDYKNPYLSPFQEFQTFKQHPYVANLLQDATRLSYGAKSLNEGGAQSIPKLTFPGGVLVGCAAGFLNVPKLKGTHLAMHSGILAAEHLFEETVEAYETHVKDSFIWKELWRARNIRPAFQKGFWRGIGYAALESYLFKGKTPWTLHMRKPDHQTLRPKADCTKPLYSKPDNQITFDRLGSLPASGTTHNENQVCHLKLKNPNTPIEINLKEYDAPETRYCPAQVYEIIDNQLHINFTNCLHCKACDIKDPTQNITWTTPEGGGGPLYQDM